MTVPVGSELGAEIEAGGRAGLGQSAGSGLGGELSANWFRSSSGNLATGLASSAPSFRSSWQSAVNAWRFVSRGTNSVENKEAEETPINARVTTTEEGLTQRSGQTNSVAARANSPVSVRLTAANADPSISNAVIQAEAQTQPGRAPWTAAQNAVVETAPTASTVSNAADGSGKVDSDGAGSQSQRQKQNNVAHATGTDTQPVFPAIDASNWLALAPTSLPPAATSLSPVPASSEISMRAQTGEAAPLSASSSTLQGTGSAQPPLLAQLTRADRDADDPAGNLADGIAGSTGPAGSGARSIRTGATSSLRGATGSHAARETAATSLGDASQPAASLRTALSASSKLPAADAPWGSSTTAPAAATGENVPGDFPSASRANNFTHSELGGSAKPSAVSHAAASSAAQTSIDAAQDLSQQTQDATASRGSPHDAAQGTVSIAAHVATAQPVTVDAAAAALRSSVAASVPSSPASGHAQVAAAASSATSAQDTFSALDRESSVGTPAWTHAGGQHAEAGFRDPDLGWVGVRADLNTGGIRATLVPSSAEASQTLSGHLAGLSSHLVEQQTTVASLSMASPGEGGADSGMGQHMQQGAEGNAQGSTPEEPQATPQRDSPLESSTSTLAATTESGVPETHAYPGELRGTHISVMA